MTTFELVKNLCEIDGVSGNEEHVREYIESLVKDHCECRTDARGNLICFKKGNNNAYAIGKVSPGQMIGKAEEYSALPDKQLKKRVMKELKGGDALLAVPVVVTTENMTFEAIVRDDSNLFIHPHDGTLLRLYVNGKQLKELDSTSGVEPKWISDREARTLMFDQRLRKWDIPLGKMFKKGEKVLVTIECFSRGNTRGDKVLLTYSTKEGK